MIKRRNKFGWRGVKQDGNRFVARIRRNHKDVQIGRYKTAEAAGNAVLRFLSDEGFVGPHLRKRHQVSVP